MTSSSTWRSPVTHTLKTWEAPFYAVSREEKTHEIRNNADRAFRVGDHLLLQLYEPKGDRIIGPWVLAKVTYITRGGEWGLPADLDVLSIRVLDRGGYEQ